jgi:hypothetical protein
MITFEEHQDSGYASRTILNASVDVTLAFATDFTSAGEKLTKQAVKDQRKLYIPIKISSINHGKTDANVILKKIIELNQKEININIAGNGIYTFKGTYSQGDIDYFIYHTLQYLIKCFLPIENIVVKNIRSGGQTGADEAGLKAAAKLNIPAFCLAPKGWKFRNEFGQDISDEHQFKQRFADYL